jgi:glycosyltransferase involved in cell wall biosynthesis
LHILVIAQYFPPDGGGGSRRVSNALLGLQRRGHKIEVITAFPHYPHGIVPKKYQRKAFAVETWNNIRIFRVWIPSIPHEGTARRSILYVSFAFSALMVLPFVKQPDIIWAANSNIFSSFPALICSLFKKTPVVRNVDDLWPETAIEEGYLSSGIMTRIGQFIAKAAYKLCRALTPISSGYRREIIRQYSVPAEKIHVVEAGVDTDVFHPAESAGLIENKRNGGDLTVMYSGILGTGYNLDLLLNIAKLISSNNNIKISIRGFGEREQEILNKIKKRGLDNVKLSNGFLPQMKLVELLNSADILILPMMPSEAHEAGIPTKLLEYMACGKPIVCCSDGEAADFVKQANCGVVVSPRDPKYAAKAILTLRDDESLRAELGWNGYTYVMKHLSLIQIAKKLERVFHSAIRPQSP